MILDEVFTQYATGYIFLPSCFVYSTTKRLSLHCCYSNQYATKVIRFLLNEESCQAS